MNESSEFAMLCYNLGLYETYLMMTAEEDHDILRDPDYPIFFIRELMRLTND